MSEYSSEYFVTQASSPERKRKSSSPRQIQPNIIALNMDENSDSDFEKNELPDFSDFVSDNGPIQQEGKEFENADKGLSDFDGFPHSLLRMAYEGNQENILNKAENRINDHESTPSKKMKMALMNGLHPVKTEMMSSDESEHFCGTSSSSLCRDFPTQASPAQSHVMSATGDTGWYEVRQVRDTLHVISTPDSNKGQPCVQKVLQTINMASIAQTAPGTEMTSPQPVFSTPVCQQSNCVKRFSSPNFVYTPHPRSGQVLYVTDPCAITPEPLHPSKAQTVTPLMMNGTNMMPPYTPVSQMCPQSCLNSSGDENTHPSNDGKVSAHTPRTSSPIESKDEESAAYPLLDSPQAMDEERESHNMKERKRRARIKEACDLMRQLVPGMSEKTDKATVFEFAARYIYFLKNFVGSAHDKDFLIKYSPY